MAPASQESSSEVALIAEPPELRLSRQGPPRRPKVAKCGAWDIRVAKSLMSSSSDIQLGMRNIWWRPRRSSIPRRAKSSPSSALENIDFGLNPQSGDELLKNMSPSRLNCSLRSLNISSPDFLALGERLLSLSLRSGTLLSHECLDLASSPKLGIPSPKPWPAAVLECGLVWLLGEPWKYDILSRVHRGFLIY